MALLRYVDQRSKASQQAYWLVMAHETFGRPSDLKIGPLPRDDGLTHAGGAVFRRVKQQVQYLFLGTSESALTLVLFNGLIEAGEQPRQTAVRKLKEATGYWGRIVGRLKFADANSTPNLPKTCLYLMELDEYGQEKDAAGEDVREIWLKVVDAERLLQLAGTNELCAAAESIRKKADERVKHAKRRRRRWVRPRFLKAILRSFLRFSLKRQNSSTSP